MLRQSLSYTCIHYPISHTIRKPRKTDIRWCVNLLEQLTACTYVQAYKTTDNVIYLWGGGVGRGVRGDGW